MYKILYEYCIFMMNIFFGSIECFNVHSGVENISSQWQKLIKIFEIFLTASGVIDDNRKEAILPHCIGEENIDL